jgi:hypothetical protein
MLLSNLLLVGLCSAFDDVGSTLIRWKVNALCRGSMRGVPSLLFGACGSGGVPCGSIEWQRVYALYAVRSGNVSAHDAADLVSRLHRGQLLRNGRERSDDVHDGSLLSGEREHADPVRCGYVQSGHGRERVYDLYRW